MKFFLVFVQPTCFGYHQRNGRFGRNAVGVVWYIGLRMDHCLLDHLERPSFIWKGIYCISAIIFISSRNKKELLSKTILKLIYLFVDHLVYGIVSLLCHVRIIGQICYPSRCLHWIVEGKKFNLTVVLNHLFVSP